MLLRFCIHMFQFHYFYDPPPLLMSTVFNVLKRLQIQSAAHTKPKPAAWDYGSA